MLPALVTAIAGTVTVSPELVELSVLLPKLQQLSLLLIRYC